MSKPIEPKAERSPVVTLDVAGGLRWNAMQIALVYLIGSVAWILVSDVVAVAVAPTPRVLEFIQSFKGLFFVACSATVLYLLIHRALAGREHAAEVVRIAKDRYELAVAGSEEIVWDWDIANDRTYWSGRLLETLGIVPDMATTSSVIGREWESRLHVDDRDRVWHALQSHVEKDTPYDVEYRLRDAEGRYRWFRSRGRAIRDTKGKATRMVGAMSDVTIRHEAEAAIRGSEARFRAIFDQHPYPMWIFNRGELKFQDVNRAAIIQYGYSREEFLRLSIGEICPPEELPRLERFIKTQDPDSPYVGEWKHKRKDGTLIDVLASTCRLPTNDGTHIRLGTFVDVTEANAMERALKESESRYRQIVETAEEGIWLVDTDWRTTFANKSLGRMLGVEPDSMIGKHIFEFMTDEDRRQAEVNMQRRKQGIAEQHEFRLRRADGSELWTLISTNAMHDDQGAFTGALAMLTDITERRRSDDILRSERELFLAGPAIAWRWKNAAGWPVLYVSKNISTFGYQPEDFTTGRIAFADVVHPDDLQRVADEVARAMELRQKTFQQEYRMRNSAGRYRWIRDYSMTQFSESGEIVGFAGYTIDSEERKAEERWQEDQRRVLEQLASNVDLSIVLETIVKAVQDQEPGMSCSILGLQPDQTVRTLAAPNLPRSYCNAIDGFSIGPNVGSCGTAMYRRERVIVSDIQTDPLWTEFKGVANEYGLRACWSEPIIASNGQVLGSLAMYYNEPRIPDDRELRLISVAAGLAAIAIERGRSEQALRDSQQRLSMLVRATPLGVIFWDTSFRVAEWNHGAELIFGHSPQEAIGRSVEFIVPAEARPYVEQILRKLSSNTGGSRGTNANIRKDGRTIYCEWYNTPLVSPDGKVLGVASVVEDVTERRIAQQRQSFMLSELDHRVKNTLAAVMSLCQQTGRMSSSYEEFQKNFNGRLRALARMHDVLARSNWRGIDLRTLVAQTLDAFSTTNRSEIIGDDLMLPARVVQAMSMALNELATNAAKYGSLTSPAGAVSVRWSIEPTEYADAVPGVHDLVLTWTERDGPIVQTPSRRGFGTELIEGAIAFELHGRAKMEYVPTGLVCTMRFPLGHPEPAQHTSENDSTQTENQ